MSGLRKKKGVYFNAELPGIDAKVKYRSFTVGETKELLIAKDLKDAGAFTNTILKIMCAAVEGVKVEDLPMYLVDYLFLKIYIRSAGDKVNARYNCPGHECDHSMALQLDLNKTQIDFPEGFVATKLIDLGDDMSVKLRVPTFEAIRAIPDTMGMDMIDKVIFSGIECIVDGEDVKVPGIDFTEEELTEWIDSLDAGIFEEIKTFFESFPEVILPTHIKCPKCGHEQEHMIRGIDNFLV